MIDPRPLVLLGASASGKTEVALCLAESLGAEIVSVDSRQIFQGMEIGSAAPTAEERARVPHHLVAEADPRRPWSAGEFGRRARDAMAGILARGRLPLLVGGSGLYLRAALGGLAESLPRDPAVREQIRARLREEGSGALHAELARRDPVRAAQLSPHDAQRITRDLEILELTGRPPSELRTQGRTAESRARIVVLDRDPDELAARMRTRVLAMVQAGLAREVEALLALGLGPDEPVMRSVGFNETIAYLRGTCTREAWIDAVVGNTRRLAKRQRTWFRGLPGATWMRIPSEAPAAATAARVTAVWFPD